MKNEHGFGLIGVLMVTLVIAALAGSSVYVWHKDHKTKMSTVASKQTKSSVSPAKTTTASSRQTYKNITSLSSAPADFQTFIERVYNTDNAQCNATSTSSQTEEIAISLQHVVRDSFAEVTETCSPSGDPFNNYYVKANSTWTAPAALAGLQDYPSCNLVNQYNFTKVIFPQCYDGSNLVANTNP
jgi:hypothetical protein